MTELEQIVHAADEAHRRGVDCVLATVVRVQGSTYRRPGARMLLTLDGVRIGAISGGCLERELTQRAAWLTGSGRPVVVRYDTSSGDDAVHEFGLGCQGVVWVLLERLLADEADDLVGLLRRGIEPKCGATLATVIAVKNADRFAVGDRVEMGLTAETDAALRAIRAADLPQRRQVETHGGRIELFVERIGPPPRLLICGAGHDAAPLVALADDVGWAVTLVDTRSALAPAQRFPRARQVVACKPAELARQVVIDARTSAVVMTHNAYDDVRLLRELLASPAPYVGLLGPRSRTEAVLKALRDDGVAPTRAELARLHAPIGLDIGAETPAEIALAILAEIQATRAGYRAGFLREREGPIHEAIDGEDESFTSLLDQQTSHGSSAAASSACPIPSRS